MAKKSSTEKTFDGSKKSAFELLKSFGSSVEILTESDVAEIKEYIDTGNYMLNACMTGSLFKGVPSGRMTMLSGESGTGKSYLAVSICRNAQKMGYYPIYFDSESSIDTQFVERLGCDGGSFGIKSVNTISQVSTEISRICAGLEKMPAEDRPKYIIVIDSIGNLTSDKEQNDILEGNQKVDFTKQKELKALFRTCTSKLGMLNIPLICTSHVYQSMDLFSTKKIGGGSGAIYNASITLMLSTAKLDDKASEKAASEKVGDFTKTGVIVTATPQKSRFTIPQKVQFQIPFFKAPNPYVGLEKYLTWENSGIVRGDIISQKEYDKLSETDKAKCYEMADENGVLCYARPKDTSRKIVVSHLHKEVPVTELFTPTVLTDNLLHKLDDDVIRPNFELPSSDTMADIEELVDAGE